MGVDSGSDKVGSGVLGGGVVAGSEVAAVGVVSGSAGLGVEPAALSAPPNEPGFIQTTVSGGFLLACAAKNRIPPRPITWRAATSKKLLRNPLFSPPSSITAAHPNA